MSSARSASSESPREGPRAGEGEMMPIGSSVGKNRLLERIRRSRCSTSSCFFLECTLKRIELSLRGFVLLPFARARGLGGTEPLKLSCLFHDSLSQAGRRPAENRTLVCHGYRMTFKASTSSESTGTGVKRLMRAP